VAGMTLDGPRASRSEIEFAIRPEDVEVAPDGVPITVRVVEPLGAHTLITSDVEGHLFRAVLDSTTTVRTGDRLTLAPKPDRIRWFDPDTTAAL
jgi:multiple sugar transport system ATP-binding protein